MVLVLAVTLFLLLGIGGDALGLSRGELQQDNEKPNRNQVSKQSLTQHKVAGMAKVEEKRNPATPKICWKEGRSNGKDAHYPAKKMSLVGFPQKSYDGFSESSDDDTFMFAEDKRMMQMFNFSQITSGKDSQNTTGCPKCDFTIDFRCVHTGNRKHFHRVRDCLLPVYGLTELLRRATGEKCIVYWQDREYPSVEPIISVLLNDVKFHALSERDPCFKHSDLHYTTIQPVDFQKNHLSKVSPQMLNKARKQNRDRVDEYVPVDIPHNLKMLQCDALRIAGIGGFRKPGMVLIDRQASRRFSSTTVPRLSQSLQAIDPNLAFYAYKDGESIANTFRVFVAAAAVVGYHGAGFVNTLFASRKLCLFEVSTFADMNSTAGWRSNILLQKVSPFLVWHIYRISLEQLLASNSLTWNKLTTGQQDNIDHFIKDLPWVSMTQSSVDDMSNLMKNCLVDLWH